MFLPATQAQVLAGAALQLDGFHMAGWSEGYVIPRLANICGTPSLVRGVNHGGGGTQQGQGAYAGLHLSGDKDDDSRRHLKAEYKLIYSARCIFCKSFHHP